MVSQFQRRLSLFLVVLSATSWLVIPNSFAAEPAQAATAAISGPPAIPTLYRPEMKDLIDPPTFTEIGWVDRTFNGKKYLVHRFYLPDAATYNPAVSDIKADTVQEQWYELADGSDWLEALLAFPGCHTITTKITTVLGNDSSHLIGPCKASDPKTYNYFQSTPLSHPSEKRYGSDDDPSGASGEGLDRLETYNNKSQVLVYRTVGSNGIAQEKAPVVLRYKGSSQDIVYGIFGAQTTKASVDGIPNDSGPKQIIIYRRRDGQAIGGEKPDSFSAYATNYIRYVNCIDPYASAKPPTCTKVHRVNGSSNKPGSSDATSAGGAASLLQSWFSQNGVTVVTDLLDVDSGDKAPLLKIRPSQGNTSAGGTSTGTASNTATPTGLPGELTFTLKKVVTTNKKADQGIANNYFLFQLNADSIDELSLTDEQKKLLKESASKIYAAVDLAGNVGLIVSEKEGASGQTIAITSQTEATLDGNLIVGEFDGDKVTDPNQARGLWVAPENYQTIITKRVYNEQFLDGENKPTKVEDKVCNVAEPVVYPNINHTYDSYVGTQTGDRDTEKNHLPNKEHAGCLNDKAGGWLKHWDSKMTVGTLGQSSASDDPCNAAFEQANPLLKIVASMFCGFIYMTISAATWLAGFSVDFLIEAVGLQ